jgi:phage terminase large subunit-like protein
MLSSVVSHDQKINGWHRRGVAGAAKERVRTADCLFADLNFGGEVNVLEDSGHRCNITSKLDFSNNNRAISGRCWRRLG